MNKQTYGQINRSNLICRYVPDQTIMNPVNAYVNKGLVWFSATLLKTPWKCCSFNIRSQVGYPTKDL